jgi:hypothetical protein
MRARILWDLAQHPSPRVGFYTWPSDAAARLTSRPTSRRYPQGRRRYRPRAAM